MASNLTTTSSPIACINIGSTTKSVDCCYPDSLSSAVCQQIFDTNNGTLKKGCTGQVDPAGCLSQCHRRSILYGSLQQDVLQGNGVGPIRRYSACVNVPSIFNALNNNVLTGDFADSAQRFLGSNNGSAPDVPSITNTVTDCLSSTCRNSRGKDDCYYNHCSPVRLIGSDGVPNITAIDGCLDQLCSSGYNALPWADADVVGIGVWVSYLLQCIFLVVLYFGFIGFRGYNVVKKKRKTTQKSSVRHQESWSDLTLEFHKAQCWYTATLMIASYAYGIFEPDMLVTLMLIPLSINGILPVIFAYTLLVYFWKSSIGITILTVVVYIMANVTYWTLYMRLIPITSNVDNQLVYQQFMYKMSAIPACGGYSALSVCPNTLRTGFEAVERAGHKLRVLTPMIWTFSTAVFIALLTVQFLQWRINKATEREKKGSIRIAAGDVEQPQSKIWPALFWFSTIVFLAGMGMQLSLLSITTSLKMTDKTDWTFGQIVAVTIWIPPLLEYVYKACRHEKQNEIGKDSSAGKPLLNGNGGRDEEQQAIGTPKPEK